MKKQNKQIISLLIAFAVITSLLTSSYGADSPEPNKAPVPAADSDTVQVRLMARDNSSWNNHNPYMSAPRTVSKSGGNTYTMEINDIGAYSLVDLAIREQNSNFCTGAESNCKRTDCAFNNSPELPDNWRRDTYIKVDGITINGSFNALESPVHTYLANDDYPYFTGLYANAMLWNGWDEWSCILTGVEREGEFVGSGASFKLPGDGWQIIESVSVTFSVVTNSEYCEVCHLPVIFCECCDCGVCDRCLFEKCCELCCQGFKWCSGNCFEQWWYKDCCQICNPCGECCVCTNCPGCEICFYPCCDFCCKGLGECENPCNDCCYCKESEEPCGDCAYCNFCFMCYSNPCKCPICEDCEQYPCVCVPTFSYGVTGGDLDYVFKNFYITANGTPSRKGTAINPSLIKAVRFTFDIPDFECDGKHIYRYGSGKDDFEDVGGCMFAGVGADGVNEQGVNQYYIGNETFCYKDKQTYTMEFDSELIYLRVSAASVFEGNDGTVTVEVLGEKGVVLSSGQQKLCDCCAERPKPGQRGHVLGGEEITIFDALEILKNLVGMDGDVKNCGNSLRAALIINPKAKSPTIFDALEILKRLVNMENLIDNPVKS